MKYSCEDESQEVDFDEGLSDESDISYEIGVEDSDEAEEVDEEDDEEFTEKQVSFGIENLIFLNKILYIFNPYEKFNKSDHS